MPSGDPYKISLDVISPRIIHFTNLNLSKTSPNSVLASPTLKCSQGLSNPAALDWSEKPDTVRNASVLASNLQNKGNHISVNLRFNKSKQTGYEILKYYHILGVAAASRKLFYEEVEQQLQQVLPSCRVCTTVSEDPAANSSERPDWFQTPINIVKSDEGHFKEFELFSQVCRVRSNHFVGSSVHDLVHTRSREEGLKDQTPNLGSLHGIRELLESVCLQFAIKKMGKAKELKDRTSELESSGALEVEHQQIESKYTARQVLAMCLQDKHGSIQVQRDF